MFWLPQSSESTKRLAACLSLIAVLPLTVFSQVGMTWRIPADSVQISSPRPSMSADGRLIAFASSANTLVAGDTNLARDVYVYDLQTGITRRVSISSAGEQTNNSSFSSFCAISANGRFVAFQSNATNLVAGDTNKQYDVFVHDLQTGITERVSVSSTGTEADAGSVAPSISADGRFVAFQSNAKNLVAGDTVNQPDIFVHDRQTGITERVSISSSGAQADSASSRPSISGDGRFVAFASSASNLVAGDTNNSNDAFVHDRLTGQTQRVSVSSTGEQANNNFQVELSISANGRFVAFMSFANNLVQNDTNGFWDAFVHDRETGITERVSASSTTQPAYIIPDAVSISGNGRFVTFASYDNPLVANDTNTYSDIFVYDRQTKQTQRVSVGPTGEQSDGSSAFPCLSDDGRFVAFDSIATNLASNTNDTNGSLDVYVHQFREVIPGDIDGNDCVDDIDLFALTQDFLSAPGSASGNPNTDIDRNGTVDDFDLFTLTQHFLEGCN